MFYSQFILAKKGPLGTIWIAAHLERKLRKNQVADTDIGVSVDSILFPDVPIALRLSSHLLVGVVRIYSRKVNYLFDDCSEALLKVKQAFRSAAVDLPPEESKAPYHSITLPETFDLDDFELPDSDIFQGNYVDHHISSREQITLQDNMENVVYPTSQFGLDERFGDGDTSGLDLDEEIFLDKVNAAGHAGLSVDPQTSIQPISPLEQHEHDDGMPTNSEAMVEDAGEDIDLMDYAQAPCTPGLVEESNISNVQETSACDDHMGSEDNTLTESTVKENLENISCKSNLNQANAHKDWSVPEDPNSDVVGYMHFEENGYHSSDLGIKQGQSPHTEVGIENASSDDPTVASGSSCPAAKEVVPMYQDSIPTGQVIEASESDGLDKRGEVQNGFLKVDEIDAPSVDYLNKDHGDCNGIISKESAHNNSSLSSSCQQLGISSNIQEGSVDAEVAVNSENPCSPNGALGLDAQLQDISCNENAKDQVSQEPNLVAHDEMLSDNVPYLRPCNAGSAQLDALHTGNGHPNDLPSVINAIQVEASEGGELIDAGGSKTVVEDEQCREIDESEQNFKENHGTEHSSLEDFHPGSGKSDDKVIALGGNSVLDNVNCSAGMDLPAPEKLLSVPEGFGEPRDLLVEATPGDLTRVDESDAGSRIISGKKRSYTESTLTEQSLNSVESSRVVRTKKTIEAIPDDDDLLSSILVGRRSSVLKVKPTPPPSEITSLKRQRSAPRTSASKRKVLMDDTMVLHGDTIRQQLTNTEDIRRIRKKAPCTPPEIAMIQKQLLEEEIFGEPICTGVSVELASLHNWTYDLSRITIAQDDVKDTSLLAGEDVQLTSGKDERVHDFVGEDIVGAVDPTTTVASDMGEVSELEAVREILQPSETPLPFENKMNGHDDVMEADMIQTQMMYTGDDIVAAETSNPESEHYQRLPENVVDGGNCSIAETVDPTLAAEIESRDQVSGDVHQALDAAVQASPLDKSGAVDALLSPDEKKETECVEVNASLVDGSDGRIDDETGAVKDDDAVSALESEPDTKDGIPLEVYEHLDTVEIEKNSFEQGEYHACGPSIEIETDFSRVEYHDQLFHEGTSAEQPNINSSYPTDTVNVQGAATLDDWEFAMQHQTYPANAIVGEFSGIDMYDRDDLDYTAAANDTEFLNVDDDEVAEVTDDYTPNPEEIRITENSGWSSRTRAVAKYLQTLFVKEAECGKKALPMDNLLSGKTRKEASRMFFEALVLKTRDYIHVEQERPFDNIAIKPCMKLMKSDL